MGNVTVRKEIMKFFEATQVLLSPDVLDTNLTTDECLLIAYYVNTLAEPEDHGDNSWPLRRTVVERRARLSSDS